jgi:hypothetical protein
MNQQVKKFAIPSLRWTLGIVVLLESLRFVLSSSSAHHFAKIGLPQWIRPALGGSEIVAAVLFLMPATSLVGGYLLLFIFAIAAIVHCLHGEFEVGALIVYGMAVLVCMTYRSNGTAEIAPSD